MVVLTPTEIAQIAALIAVCGVEDRLIGWGGFGRTKPLILGVLALAGIGYWIGLKPWGIATFPLAFLAWRTPAWTMWGGSINPAPGKAIYTFFRHSLALAFVVPAWLGGLHNLGTTAALMAYFALAATLLAVVNYCEQAKHNDVIESARGICLGICLAGGFIVLR